MPCHTIDLHTINTHVETCAPSDLDLVCSHALELTDQISESLEATDQVDVTIELEC